VSAGLRYNGTWSFPVGLYLATDKHAHKDDLVIVRLPELRAFELARERGYLNVAYCTVAIF